MSIQFVKRNGDIVRICRPKVKKFQFRNAYNINIYGIQDTIVAVNETTAIFRFCLKHPLVLFRIDNLDND